MKMTSGSKMVSDAVNMYQILTKSNFGIDELMRIYMVTPVSDYFRQGIRHSNLFFQNEQMK